MTAMRTRLIADISATEGVVWCALIDADGLALERQPVNMTGQTVEDAAAMWLALPAQASDVQTMTIKAQRGWMIGRRCQSKNWILIEANASANLGEIRRTLTDVQPRIDAL